MQELDYNKKNGLSAYSRINQNIYR